jgi:hypothetical protein
MLCQGGRMGGQVVRAVSRLARGVGNGLLAAADGRSGLLDTDLWLVDWSVIGIEPAK